MPETRSQAKAASSDVDALAEQTKDLSVSESTPKKLTGTTADLIAGDYDEDDEEDGEFNPDAEEEDEASSEDDEEDEDEAGEVEEDEDELVSGDEEILKQREALKSADATKRGASQPPKKGTIGDLADEDDDEDDADFDPDAQDEDEEDEDEDEESAEEDGEEEVDEEDLASGDEEIVKQAKRTK
ncbi:hypothetical protein PENSPDRAFT_750239 [Peniophora sp. CONT]|nr:hypothetical protein PENSPDRAFT_750239 [Peniophora sp. CONT]